MEMRMTEEQGCSCTFLIIENDLDEVLLIQAEIIYHKPRKGLIQLFSSEDEFLKWLRASAEHPEGTTLAQPCILLVDVYPSTYLLDELIHLVRSAWSGRLPIAVMFGTETEKDYFDLKALQLAGYVVKPVTIEQLEKLEREIYPSSVCSNNQG